MGRTCAQYKEDLEAGDASGVNSANRLSEKEIKTRIERGEAMRCPECGVSVIYYIFDIGMYNVYQVVLMCIENFRYGNFTCRSENLCYTF